MGYSLIWLEGLSAMLLLVALLVAWTSRRRWRWLQLGLTIMAAFLWMLPGAMLTFVTYQLKFGRHFHLEDNWFFYSLAWWLFFLLGMIVVCRCGLTRAPDGVPAARAWPRAKLFLALTVALVLFGITLTNLDLAVQLQIASARAEAGEVLLAMTPPRVPDKDNAAPLYRQAFAAFTSLPPGPPEELFHLTADADKARRDLQSKQVRESLANQAKALALLRQAAQMPGCSFEFSYQQLWEPSTSLAMHQELLWMRHGARWLCLSALVHAADGDGKAAALDLKTAFAMGRHVPTVFTLHIPLHIEDVAFKALQKVLVLTTPAPEDLVVLPLEEDPPYLKKLLEEKAVHAAILVGLMAPENHTLREMMLRHPVEAGYYWLEPLAEATILPVWRAFLVPEDLSASRKIWQDYRRQTQAAGEPPYPTWAAAKDSLKQMPRGLLMGVYMLPKFEHLTKVCLDTLTRRAEARVAVALTAYRTKNGRYPVAIEELLPAYLSRVPVDPLRGQPLQMHLVGPWLVVHDSTLVPNNGGIKDREQGLTVWDLEEQQSYALFLLKAKD